MINFHLHVSGPRIRALMALAEGQSLQRHNTLVLNGLTRDGLAQIKVVPSNVEGIEIDAPEITARGLTVLELIKADVAEYLTALRKKSRP